MSHDAKHAGESDGKQRQIALTQLKKQCLQCKACEIGKNPIQDKTGTFQPQVFARGNVNAKIVLVGQNPGKTEIAQKRPFVGDAGKFLDEMIQRGNLDPKNLYITNSVKCFTPGNRTPTEAEIKQCREFLKAELAIIKPKLIITLGNPALKTIMGYTGITTRRGTVVTSEEFGCDVFPLLHPASTLHNRKLYLPMMDEDLATLQTIAGRYA